jgi:Holliday junction resolvase RusA-like endonuclease
MGGRPPFEGPLEVTVAAYWPWPKSMSAKKRRMYGSQYFTSRPDADNVMKLLGDALNGIVWRDDAQIVIQTVSKSYSLRPETVIRVTALMEEPHKAMEPAP